jgi:hypothetical protein
MSLAMPQPDWEPSLRLHLSAFSDQAEVEPDRLRGPGDEDEDADPVGDHPKHPTSQMFVIHGDRR